MANQNGIINFVMNCLQQRMGINNLPLDKNGNVDFQQIVTQMVSSGQMSQDMFNQLQNQARPFMNNNRY